MTDEQIRDLGPAFSAYLRPYRAFCNQARTAPHLDAYCRALLTEAPTKTVEPNALASGTAVRTLQKFLTTTRWDHLSIRFCPLRRRRRGSGIARNARRNRIKFGEQHGRTYW